MVTIVTQDAGLPVFKSDEFTTVELFAGTPPRNTVDEVVDADAQGFAGLPAYSVVAKDASGYLVLAELGATGPEGIPVGITVAPVAATATGKVKVAVFKDGQFNVDALNWDDSYDDSDPSADFEMKRTAFEGSHAPGIYIKKLVG